MPVEITEQQPQIASTIITAPPGFGKTTLLAAWVESIRVVAEKPAAGVMKPSEARYSVCVGPAARGLTAHAPYPHCGPVYGESNAAWDIRLADSPTGVMESASEKAQDRLREAEELYHERNCTENGSWQKTAQDLLERARQECQRGRELQTEASAKGGCEGLNGLSAANRRFNHAQVLATQANHLIHTVAQMPKVLENWD